MTILVVDTNPDRLWELVGNIRAVFRQDTVEYTHDPLMAGKFGFNYHIDVLFTELKMERMNGLRLSDLLRKQNSGMKTFLISGQKEFCTDMVGQVVWGKNNGGNLVRPVTVDMVREIADRLQPAGCLEIQPAEPYPADTR
ncbi:hypothetical protein LJC56_11635 [Christensenellaceae bacterium OttesenSCG-928-K19]|nr:hypothetical protein [Christensenellaceae bacterium OttesenSCG-928-K19]